MALYTIRSGVENHPEDTFLQLFTNLIRAGGVISLSDDHYLVEEPSGGGLNVDVNPGQGYVKSATSSTYPIRSTDTETLAVTSNTSGNPRIDAVVAYVDLNETPVALDEGEGVHKLTTVDGTPASSPSVPDDGEIQTSVGAGNPWTKIAEVNVAHNATGISNTDITDTRRRVYLKSYTPYLSVAYSTPYAHDFALTNQFEMVLTGNLTLNAPTNMEYGDWLICRLIQDGTGGRTLTLGTGLTGKSADMTLASGGGETSTIALNKVADGEFDAYLVGKDY